MKKNYISPAVEIVMTQSTTIIAVSGDGLNGSTLRDDVSIDDPDAVQAKSDLFGDYDW